MICPSRGRRSPRGRRAQPGPGSLPDTDRDRLLTDHSATYRKYPGLNNVAYMVRQTVNVSVFKCLAAQLCPAGPTQGPQEAFDTVDQRTLQKKLNGLLLMRSGFSLIDQITHRWLLKRSSEREAALTRTHRFNKLPEVQQVQKV